MKMLNLKLLFLTFILIYICSLKSAWSQSIYISDNSTSVHQYTIRGQEVRILTPGSSFTPEGMTIGPDGQLYVASQYTNPANSNRVVGIYRFNPNTGQYLGTVGSFTPNDFLYDLTFGPDAALYATGFGKVYKIDVATNATSVVTSTYFTPLGSSSKSLFIPYGLTFRPDNGHLLLSNFNNGLDGTIEEFDLSNGTSHTFATGLAGPFGIVFGQDNRLYIADGNVSVVGINGGVAKVYLSNTSTMDYFNNPRYLAFDGSGNLYVTNSGITRVPEFNSTGTYLGYLDTSGAWGIAIKSTNPVPEPSIIAFFIASVLTGITFLRSRKPV